MNPSLHARVSGAPARAAPKVQDESRHAPDATPTPESPLHPFEPRLRVAFSRDARGRTFVSAQRATHPYHLCRALYRPGDPPGLSTLYLQGCAGGVFESDRLGLALRVNAGATAHVTTAASTIVHRMPGGDFAEQQVFLDVGPGALLEFLPEPLILFPRGRLLQRSTLRLAPTARLITGDAFLPHRLPDDDAPFDWFDSRTTIEDDSGVLLARERFVARGSRLFARRVGEMGPYTCQGTLTVLGAGASPVASLRAALASTPGISAGVSTLPDEVGVIARILAADPVALRAALARTWAAARAALGIDSGRPRPK